ncbi:hypothetical protein HY213_05595 [Candidatus Peregrinibacteria bacterium]|nr:hypothetical protein [Candidatus Peregrinibacteria bacterium]
MRFRYTEYEMGRGQVVYRPTLPMTLECGSVQIPVIDALVDTGADQTVLPLSFAVAFGFRFDLNHDGEKCHGAGGGHFRVFASPKPIHFILEQEGSRTIRWTGSACFTLHQPTILLGHKGCLEYLDIGFHGKKKILEVHQAA